MVRYLAREGAGDGAVLAAGQQRNAEQDLGGVAAHRRRQQAVRVGDVLHRRVGVGPIVERAWGQQGPHLEALTSGCRTEPSASAEGSDSGLPLATVLNASDKRVSSRFMLLPSGSRMEQQVS